MHTYQALESLHWVGVISVTVIVISSAIPVFSTKFNPAQSVSQSWSLNARGHKYISIILTVFGALLSLFLAGWLVPTYHLWQGMYVVTTLGYVSVLGIAWFPMTQSPGEHSLRHPHFLGGAMTACGALVAYGALLVAHPPIPPVSHYAVLSACIFTALWPVFFVRGIRDYFLILEVILVLFFVSALISLTLGV